LLQAKGLSDYALAGVFVDGVVGDEAWGSAGGLSYAVSGLGVQILVVIDEAGQEGGAGERAVEGCDAIGGYGLGEIWFVGLGAGDGVVECDWRGNGRLLGRCE
jgi:hypothetical protein